MNKSTAAVTSPDQGRTFYRAMVLRRQVILLGLLGALFLSFCVDLALGPARYALTHILSALLTPGSVSKQISVIVWQIRMPVALMAIVVGASLSIAGAQMQTLLSNPLASPFALGISVRRWRWPLGCRSFRSQWTISCRSMRFWSPCSRR